MQRHKLFTFFPSRMSSPGKSRLVRSSSRADLPLNVVTSLDELTHYDTKLHNNLMAINDFRSSYEDSKAANKDLSEIPEFKLWENARIEEILQRADQIVPEDATQIIDLLKRYGKDMANKQ